MTEHARQRLKERFAGVNYDKIELAVSEYLKDDNHPEVELVMKARDSAIILRYTGQGALVYPLVDTNRGVIFTVYTQTMIRRQKVAKKFKRSIRSSPEWRA